MKVWTTMETKKKRTRMERQKKKWKIKFKVIIDFLLTVKVATLMFISGRGLAISSAKEGKSGFIYNLVKSS